MWGMGYQIACPRRTNPVGAAVGDYI
jgi:hypothetical protein